MVKFHDVSKGIGYMSTAAVGLASAVSGVREALSYVLENYAHPDLLVPATALLGAAASYAGMKKLIHPLAKKSGAYISTVSKSLSGKKKLIPPTAAVVGAATLIGATPLQNSITGTTNAYERLDSIVSDYTDSYGPPTIPNAVLENAVNTTSKHSVKGRIARTLRYEPLIQEACATYNFSPELVIGLIAQESYGNPLQLNSTGDGGAGLGQFQPGTAQSMGLKTYGTSKRTGADKKHGSELKNLNQTIDENTLGVLDERFDPEKAIPALVTYLVQEKKRWKTDDIGALSAYNRGRPHKDAKNTAHVRGVLKYADAYKDQRLILESGNSLWHRIWAK